MTDERNLVIQDLKDMRQELYELLRDEVRDQPQDVVVQQGMAMQAKGGDGNRQLQIVNVTYNRNVHLKVIDLLKTLDNAIDNARDAFDAAEVPRQIPFPIAEPLPLPEGEGPPSVISMVEAFGRGVGLHDFLTEARIAYALYAKWRMGTGQKAAERLKVQRTYLSKVMNEYKLKGERG